MYNVILSERKEVNSAKSKCRKQKREIQSGMTKNRLFEEEVHINLRAERVLKMNYVSKCMYP